MKPTTSPHLMSSMKRTTCLHTCTQTVRMRKMVGGIFAKNGCAACNSSYAYIAGMITMLSVGPPISTNGKVWLFKLEIQRIPNRNRSAVHGRPYLDKWQTLARGPFEKKENRARRFLQVLPSLYPAFFLPHIPAKPWSGPLFFYFLNIASYTKPLRSKF